MSDDNKETEENTEAQTTVTAKKKASKKKVAKKTAKKKVAKKTVSRKKAVSKKGIQLKADSHDLDSFASHAATAQSTDDFNVNSALVLNEAELNALKEAEEDIAFKPKPMPEPEPEPKLEEATNSEIHDTKAHQEPDVSNKTVQKAVTPAPTEILDVSTEPSKDLAVIIKLLVAAGLFLSFSWYVQTVFNDKSQQATDPVVIELVEAPEPRIKIETVTIENNAPLAELQLTPSAEIAKVESEKNVTELTKATEEMSHNTDKSPNEVVASYPPPPAPTFLVIPSVKQDRPLPDDQMELIKQTFAPELFK